jgi:DivIVA domain-containing protein
MVARPDDAGRCTSRQGLGRLSLEVDVPIERSLLDLHRFTVRRRGYDPNEVDSVLRRVADSLRRYEERIADLEADLSEASDAADAVGRTMVAAQRAHDQMVEEAAELAKQILIEADGEATRISHETADQARAHLDSARRDALGLLEEAHTTLQSAHEDLERMNTEANTLLEVATDNAATTRRRAEETVRNAAAEAERTVAVATAAADEMREEARHVLELALAEAATSDAITKQRAEDLLAVTRREAHDLLAVSRREAESLVSSAVREVRDLRMQVKGEAEELQARAHARFDETTRLAEAEAAESAARAATRATAVIDAAEIEASEMLARGKSDAAARLATAQTQAEQLLEGARAQATEILSDARREKLSLLQRIAELRRAVTDVERHLQLMAARTLDQSHLIHEVIAQQEELERQLALELDHSGGAEDGEDLTIDITDTTVEHLTVDHLRATAHDPFAAPDGSGRPPAARGTVDPRHPPTFERPRMRRVSGSDARAGRSISAAIAASRRA